MKHRLTIIAALTICSTFCSGAQLEVQVTNGTTKTTAPVDTETIVQIYVQGNLLYTFEGRTDTEGKAVFQNVPEGEDVTAVARAKYKDMMFGGRPIKLTPSQAEHVASVLVFDVSEDKSQLSVETHHFIVKAKPGSLEITEYMQLRNSSDFAIISSERDDQNRPIVMAIRLPRGFRNLRSLSYFEDHALAVTDDGFYDTMAVPPGEQHATFSYTLDVPAATMEVVKTISLPTSEFVLFADLGEAKIEGLDRPAERAARSSGEMMQYYSRKGLSPGEQIAFRLTGLKSGPSGPAKWIIAAAVVSVTVIVAALCLSPKEKSNSKGSSSRPE